MYSSFTHCHIYSALQSYYKFIKIEAHSDFVNKTKLVVEIIYLKISIFIIAGLVLSIRINSIDCR